MSDNSYLLDANVFIQAKNDYYRFEICPGFWTLLERHDRVGSIDQIRGELTNYGDRISDWVATLPESFFKKTQDKAVIEAFQQMMTWVQSEPQFSQAARNEFASVADGWLIAFAKVNGLVVTTHETYEPNVKVKVKIPNVCVEFDVEYINTFDMLVDLNANFKQSPRHRK